MPQISKKELLHSKIETYLSMHCDQVINDLVDVRASVIDDGVTIRPVAAHVHAGLDGAHQWVALVLQVRVRDGALQSQQGVLSRL